MLPKYPAKRLAEELPPSISHAPPRLGSMDIERTDPPVAMAYSTRIGRGVNGGTQTWNARYTLPRCDRARAIQW